MARTRRCASSCSAFGGRIADVGRQMGLGALPRRALELEAYGIDEPALVVGDDEINAGETAAFEPDKILHPTAFGFAAAQLESEDLPVAGGSDANREQRTAGTHTSPFANLPAPAHPRARTGNVARSSPAHSTR